MRANPAICVSEIERESLIARSKRSFPSMLGMDIVHIPYLRGKGFLFRDDTFTRDFATCCAA